MRSFVTGVTECVRLYGETHAVWFRRPEHFEAGRPGQFVMLFAGDATSDFADPLLGRPFWIHRLRTGAHAPEFGLLFEVVGRVTEWLARRREGDEVRLVGPLGRGFEPRERVQKMLLVGRGIGVAPLAWLADTLLADGREVTLVLGGAGEAEIYPASLLPSEVELVVTTEDGSLGESGRVTAPFERLLPWCDQAFACAPASTLEALHQVTRASGTTKPVQALVQAPMACGTGLCDSCVVFPRRGGVKLVCTDGPMFDLRDLYA